MVALRETVRRDYPGYHAAPVPAWNVRGARLLIVGLAPGMHGANATGRPFTGAPLHIVHVNSSSLWNIAPILELIGGAQERGIDVTIETCPPLFDPHRL